MLTKQFLENFLKSKFSDQNIVFEGEGWGSFAFSAGENIIRFPKTYDISSYKKEEYILNFLQDKISFEIPKPKIVYDNPTYIIHKKLLGESWSVNSYNKLSVNEKNLFCEDIAKFFYEMHSVKLNELDKKFIKKQDLLTFDNFIDFLKDDFSSFEIEKLYNYYLKVKNAGSDYVLVHQDFYEANSLVDKNHRLKAIFDFGNCEVAERCIEFRTLDYDFYKDLFERVLSIDETISNIKINVDRIKELNSVDTFGCLNYLNSDKKLKESMKKSWDECIEKIRNIKLN